MADQVRVFVSHHHSPEEDAFTAQLVSDLKAAGVDVWVDVAGVGAADFQERINQALSSCEWLVLVMTPASLASPWVRTEVHAAIRLMMQGRMRGIIQIVAQPVAQEQIPPTWRVYTHFDATQDYAAALTLSLRELGLIPLASKSGAPPPMPSAPTSAQTVIPSDRFPPHLAALGFELHVLGGVEVIMPPMCDVPAGPFLMGSDPKRDREAYDNERPQQSVTLAAFQIGKYPVTVAEYSCFVRAGYREPQVWSQQVGGLDHPVRYLSWHEAVAYVKWLKERLAMLWRLPTEAEWEKAARGTDGRIYPLGDDFDASRANTMESKNGGTTPVDSYPTGTSPYGVLDMVGNVKEWRSLHPPRGVSPSASLVALWQSAGGSCSRDLDVSPSYQACMKR